MDWMMEDGYWKLKEKAQHRKEWSCWTFGPARRQMTWRRSNLHKDQDSYIQTVILQWKNIWLRSAYLEYNRQLFRWTTFVTAICQPDLESSELLSKKTAVLEWWRILENVNELRKTVVHCKIPCLPNIRTTTTLIFRANTARKSDHSCWSFIHSFVTEIYIAPLQGYYSEALPIHSELRSSNSF